MPKADAESIQFDAIERDRRRREEEMLLLLLLVVGAATRQAVSAHRMGYDPARAAMDVIQGSDWLELPGLTATLTQILATSYTDGQRRTDLTIGRRPPIIPPDAATLNAFRPKAQLITDNLSRDVAEEIQAAVSEGMNAGIGTRKVAVSIREEVKSAGYIGENPWVSRAITERAIISSHGAGMWAGWNEPDKWNRIAGFVHHSIIDEGTTNICRERDGFTRPRDDAYWRTNWPSLHYGCRSVVTPVFSPREWSTVYPTTAPQPGFGAAAWLSPLVAA